MIYSMWYNVPIFLEAGVPEYGGTDCVFRATANQATDRQQSGDIIPHAVNHSLAFLRMGKELPEIC